MPVRNFPFKALGIGTRPLLPVIIINPLTNEQYKTHGIIDTGSDICVVSSDIADIIGHNLKQGKKKDIEGVGFGIDAWLHTTTIKMFNFRDIQFHEITSAPIAYVEEFDYVVLGVSGFLEKFRLEIDYPKKHYSIRNSRPKKKSIPTP